MKIIRFVYLLFFGLWIMAACKPDPASEQKETEAAVVQEASPSQEAPGEGHDFTILTDKIFHYKAAYVVGAENNEQPFKDEWIDLMPDGRFKAGKLKEQTHTGIWSYNEESKVLFLKPNEKGFNMSEWKVMYNDKMMVWVGTQTYGNNATQIQLVRSDVLPGETPK